MRKSLVDIFLTKAKTDKRCIFITADLGFNVLDRIYNEIPEQFVNVGIAEQNMASVAAGMALEGKCVFVYSIGNFSSLRCLEQIRNDICYHNLNVKIVSLAAGFAYGQLGMSHHATEDIACMRVMPNVCVFSPCDPLETIAVTKAAMEINTPCFIRLGRGGEPKLWEAFDTFEIGKAYKMFDGDDGVVFSTGSITKEAIDAVEEMKKRGMSIALYTFPTIKPIDEDVIKECAKKYKKIVTLEEHQNVGGFGSAVSEVVSKIKGNRANVESIGLNGTFTCIVGDTDYLRKRYHLDSTAIVEALLNE